MTAPPPHAADTALSRLFTGANANPNVSWISIPGGQTRCAAGETADQSVVRTGRGRRSRRGAESVFLVWCGLASRPGRWR